METDELIVNYRALRDQGIALVILFSFLSLALIFSNFGADAKADAAQAGVDLHKKLLSEVTQVLAQNQNELDHDDNILVSFRNREKKSSQ